MKLTSFIDQFSFKVSMKFENYREVENASN